MGQARVNKSIDLWVAVANAPGLASPCYCILMYAQAAIAQLGERQTEDLKVPASIPGLGIMIENQGQRSSASMPCRSNGGAKARKLKERKMDGASKGE